MEPIELKENLRDCPFCGDRPMFFYYPSHKHVFIAMADFPGTYSVECVKCEIRLYRDSKTSAVHSWNARVEENNK